MVRVLIADDFQQMIEVMKDIIDRVHDVEVVGVVKTLHEMLERVSDIEHDVILMNDYLRRTNSVIASRRLRRIGVEAPIVVISMERDGDLVRDSLAAGANGFILKEEFTKHLLQAIRTVSQGEQYLSPLARSLLTGEE